MAFSTDDFNKVWASTSPLTPYDFSDDNYKQGWNFIGATPPSRQMWDYLQKLTDEKIKYIYNNMIPCGIVQAFAGNTVPDGWLLCDGSAVSRTDYAELYAVIGDTYGNGDGSTTFNLPNLVDKFIEGSSTAGTSKTAGLPDVEGSFVYRAATSSSGNGFSQIYNPEGAYSSDVYASSTATGKFASATNDGSSKMTFKASNSNSIYGNSNTVQPPALTMQYIIKY